MSPRPITDSQGREVVDLLYGTNLDGTRFLQSAVYLDDGTGVPDDELDRIEREVLSL